MTRQHQISGSKRLALTETERAKWLSGDDRNGQYRVKKIITNEGKW